MVEARVEVSEEQLEQSLSLYKKFFFNHNPEQRSLASREIDKMLKREKGYQATLGIEFDRKTKEVSIDHLTYREISIIFTYLDAETILMVFNAAKDIKAYSKVQDGQNERLVAKRGTFEFNLPAYLRIPIYRAVASNLRSFSERVAQQTKEEFLAEIQNDQAFQQSAKHLELSSVLYEKIKTPCEVTTANYQDIMRNK